MELSRDLIYKPLYRTMPFCRAIFCTEFTFHKQLPLLTHSSPAMPTVLIRASIAFLYTQRSPDSVYISLIKATDNRLFFRLERQRGEVAAYTAISKPPR